jgi:lipopolysaccharide transport system ATP-binding protein
MRESESVPEVSRHTPVLGGAGRQPWADDVVVSVRGVGKLYRLYARPQDRLKHMLFARLGRGYGREFWALRDVSFDIRRGDVWGIIGRNGSGKSTLLQIMAGIVQPAAGEVKVRGRVAALLELGSGFNPDCTGRENILMNAVILGIRRAEMQDRLDEIAAFADIGEFIDQPVKTYSSGMFVRLGFSVTTSLDADVLLIDEALAVGDVFFRQKCYQRLETLRAKGVSIVLVSHAMMEVEQFCQRALLLQAGQPVFLGSAAEAVKRYYLIEQDHRVPADGAAPAKEKAGGTPGTGVSSDESFWPEAEARLDISGTSQVSNGWARCTGAALCDGRGQACHVFEQGERATFFYEFELLRDVEVPTGGVEIINERGVIVHGKSTLEYGTEVPRHLGRGCRLRFRQDVALELAVGEYTFNLGMGALSGRDYDLRSLYSHAEMDPRLVRLCLLPAVGKFAVVFRQRSAPVQLLHHGVANLPGACHVSLTEAPAGVRSSAGGAGASVR